MNLSSVLKVLNKIAEEPKTREKKLLLEKHCYNETFQRVIMYALDFTKRFGVKKFPPEDFRYAKESNPHAIFDFLDKLSETRGTSNLDIVKLARLCANESEIEVVRRIVNKDLRCGVNLKLASKYFPELPTKSIMLCAEAARVILKEGKKPKISPELDKFVAKCGGWKNVGVSDKEDGVRDKMVLSGQSVSHISRNGLPYSNFHCFDSIITTIIDTLRNEYGLLTAFLDGEVVSADDNFQKQMTQIRRLESVDDSIFRLKLFDIGGTNLTQRKREAILKEVYDNLPKKMKKKVTPVLCNRISDKDAFLRLYDHITNTLKKEGVVLKDLNGVYEGKRSSYWCKVKTFFSVDLIVLKAVKGKEGKKFGGVLGALLVDFKGVPTKIGSGYTPEERISFLEHSPKMIEVEYKCITADGKLFHASFQRVREDK